MSKNFLKNWNCNCFFYLSFWPCSTCSQNIIKFNLICPFFLLWSRNSSSLFSKFNKTLLLLNHALQGWVLSRRLKNRSIRNLIGIANFKTLYYHQIQKLLGEGRSWVEQCCCESVFREHKICQIFNLSCKKTNFNSQMWKKYILAPFFNTNFNISLEFVHAPLKSKFSMIIIYSNLKKFPEEAQNFNLPIAKF